MYLLESNEDVYVSSNDYEQINDSLNNKDDGENNVLTSINDQIVSEIETPVISVSRTSLYYQDYDGIDVTVSVKEKPTYIYPNAKIKYSLVNYGELPDYLDGTTDSEGKINIDTYYNYVGNYTLHILFHNTYFNQSITINKVPLTIKVQSIIKADNKHSFLIKAIIDSSINYYSIPDVYFVIDGKFFKANCPYDVEAYLKVAFSNIKTYDYSVILKDNNYQFNHAKGKIIVKNFNVKISAKRFINVIGESSILKAIVKDSNGKNVNEGIVKFIINGKAFSVKVKNGIAIKKIKLSKIKIYKYTAIYSSKYIKSKISKSYVLVKKIPTFTVKIGIYKIKISYIDYKKIKKAKDRGYFHKLYDTGKKITYKVYQDKKVTITKKKLWMDDTSTTQRTYHDAWNTPIGYSFSHYETKRVGGHIKTYMVYKKTFYKKVLVKHPKTKVYIIVDSTPTWGATAQLYYIKYKYDSETSWFISKSKQIF